MTFVILFVLAALWAVVLVPPLLRARTGRSNDSIGDFKYRLGVLSRTNGSGRRRSARRQSVVSAPIVSSPPRPVLGGRMSASQRAAKRRRDITLGLLVATALTLLFAVFARSSSVWLLQGLVDVMLVGYLGLLAWFRSAAERPAPITLGSVQYLSQRRAPELGLQPAPELALRRTASS